MHNVNVILTKQDVRYRSLYFKTRISFFLNTYTLSIVYRNY